MSKFARAAALLATTLALAGAASEPAGDAQRSDLTGALEKDVRCESADCHGESSIQLLQLKASPAPISALEVEKIKARGLPPNLPPLIGTALLQRMFQDDPDNDASGATNGTAPVAYTSELCKEKPQECGPPCHCEIPVTPQEKLSWWNHFAVNGHANVRSWCGSKGFTEGIVKECLVNRDLSKAGKITYEEQKKGGAAEPDGSYCFIVGHCDNDKVTNDTTIEEMEEMCTAKYGDEWTKVGPAQLHPIWWGITGQISVTTGFHDEKLAHWYAMLACSQGNYHCDVVYCRENYCNVPYYKEKYGQYAKGGHPSPAKPIWATLR